MVLNTLESHLFENSQNAMDTCAKFIIEDVTVPFVLTNITAINNQYTFSCWLRSDVNASVQIQNEYFESTTDWKKYSMVFKSTDTNLSIYFKSVGTYYIYHPKLEIGNIATDWTPAPEDNDDAISDIRNTIVNQRTEILNDCKSIVLSALETYVETGDYEEFKETVSSQLEILADQISMTFTTVSKEVTDVDGEMQSKFNELYKYITFDGENGITIGSSDSAIKLIIDNDGILFTKDGVVFGSWDGVDFHTGNIVVDVNERAQFGDFAFLPNHDGSLSFVKVGG